MVLIVVDTLRRDHLSVYGHVNETSPNIDSLAADGVRFERAYSHAPWTTPSIGSLLTSRYPSELGIKTERAILPEGISLLPEVMGGAGYQTLGVISHSFCSSRWGFSRGFDKFDETNILGHAGICSEGVADRAIEFLDEATTAPVFLFLHFFDPHGDYLSHEEHAFGASEPLMPYLHKHRTWFELLPHPILAFIRPIFQAIYADELLRVYDSEIAFTDRHIGRVLDHLKAKGLYDDAVIAFTVDHGEEFWDHGSIGHARTLFDELVHVPLIVKAPGVAPGVREDLVGLVDVFPTLLELVGIPPRGLLRGRSLFAPAADRRVFVETSWKDELRAVITRRHKLILDLETSEARLFDLKSDPHERSSLTETETALAAELLGSIRRWDEQLLDGVDPVQTTLSKEEEDELRKLGYLGD